MKSMTEKHQVLENHKNEEEQTPNTLSVELNLNHSKNKGF
jgi:hypothetical protein